MCTCNKMIDIWNLLLAMLAFRNLWETFSAWWVNFWKSYFIDISNFHFTAIATGQQCWTVSQYQWVFLPVEGRMCNLSVGLNISLEKTSGQKMERKIQCRISYILGLLHSETLHVQRVSLVLSEICSRIDEFGLRWVDVFVHGLQLDSPRRETDWLPLRMEINHKFLHV